MPRTLRTFVAVEIPDDVRRRAGRLIAQLAQTSARVRWVEAANLHLTLKFLGNVERLEIPKVCAAVQRATDALAPFNIELSGAGAFPTPHNPRTIWLGVGQGSEAMITLHDAIEEALLPLGFRGEGRRFRPHLTLGRVRDGQTGRNDLAELLQTHGQFSAGTTNVDEAAIFSSQIGPDGPHYELLAHASLDGR